ncbi:MAG TPA: glutamate racemase [Oscillatoriaceae cyanobacterium]
MTAPIGLYDSGIGGLSVVREVFRQLPGESVLYFGDTARVPYGPRPASEILAFNREIVGLLQAAGARLIVVACNTSSALALPSLVGELSVPIVGLIGPGAEAAVARGRRIGVIATEGTVRSGAYGKAIRALAPDAEVREVACPPLVPLVESGRWDGPEAEAVVRVCLAPFLADLPDCLVLGCTHYPLLAPLIQRVLGSRVALVDPAARAIEVAARLLGPRATGTPSHRFMVSGEPTPFYESAARLFPGVIASVEQAPLPLALATS